MCFSAEASFTAALMLGVTGIASIKKTSTSSQLFLAAIPLLFAFQQLAEGIVWLYLNQSIGSRFLFFTGQKIFLFFAFLIWPIWIPLSAAVLEQIPWRRVLLYLNLLVGVILSLLNLSYGLHQIPNVQVINHSLQYLGHAPSQTILYPLIVLLPCFLSSLKNLWVCGVIITIGYFVASYFYTATFISVWCFFAAIVSFAIYKMLKDNTISPKNEPFKKVLKSEKDRKFN